MRAQAATKCWCDNIRLVVNSTTGLATNVPGVQTRVPYWGSTEGFEELDPSIPLHGSAAFRNMVLALEAAGYKKNVTLRGAPCKSYNEPTTPLSFTAATATHPVTTVCLPCLVFPCRRLPLHAGHDNVRR